MTPKEKTDGILKNKPGRKKDGKNKVKKASKIIKNFKEKLKQNE